MGAELADGLSINMCRDRFRQRSQRSVQTDRSSELRVSVPELYEQNMSHRNHPTVSFRSDDQPMLHVTGVFSDQDFQFG